LYQERRFRHLALFKEIVTKLKLWPYKIKKGIERKAMEHLPFWYINGSVVLILAYYCLFKLPLLLPGGEKPELECYTTQELYFEVCSL
jgi:hypothetical protein